MQKIIEEFCRILGFKIDRNGLVARRADCALLEFSKYEMTAESKRKMSFYNDRKTNIIHVTYNFKFAVSYVGAYDTSMLLKCGSHNSFLSEIKTTDFDGNISAFGAADCLIKLKLKNGDEHYILIRHDRKTALQLINRIKVYLKPNEIEYFLRKEIRHMVTKVSSNFWERNWESEGAHDFYEKTGDVDIIEKFYKVSEFFRSTGNSSEICVLDVGGGKGRLAKKILDNLKQRGIRAKYYLIEPSVSQCRTAKMKLSELQLFHDIIIINSTLENNFMHLPKMHCIISSGGPLNAQVVSHAEAEHNAKIMFLLLREDGVVIANGASRFLLTSKNFRRIGFDIEVSVAGSKADGYDSKSLYILKKPRHRSEPHSLPERKITEQVVPKNLLLLWGNTCKQTEIKEDYSDIFRHSTESSLQKAEENLYKGLTLKALKYNH